MADLSEWDVTVTMVRTVDGRKETRDFTVRVPAAGTSGAETAAHGIGYAINEGSGYAWKFASAVRVQRVDGCVSGRRADGAPLPPMCCGGWVNSNGGAATLCEPCPPAPLAPVGEVTRDPDVARAGLAAVAPLIRAQVLREAADHFAAHWYDREQSVLVARQLRNLADTLLPPASDETREHPADRPTEGAARREADRD